MSETPTSTVSAGNPFADLGMADADTRLAKAKLALRITAFMDDRNLTQGDLAQILEIDLPKVAAITRGQLKDFSLDQLMALVNRLDMDVEIHVIPNPEPTRRARTVVQDPEGPLVASAEADRPAAIRFD